MTDKERLATLRRAVTALKQTTRGYTPDGMYWRAALRHLRALEEDLTAPKVPALGPIVAGGVSVLNQDCTHITSGLGWPAFDDGFDAGRPVVAPEGCVVSDDSSSAQGGDAFYLLGDSGLRYWVGHITVVPRQGRRFSRGEVMTRVSSDHPRPHVHLAIDARYLIGHHLKSHTDYTHGAPKIGVQLAEGLT